MESLTLSEDALPSRQFDRLYTPYHDRHTRLPTPATSCSSNEGNDSSETRKEHSSFDILLRSSPGPMSFQLTPKLRSNSAQKDRADMSPKSPLSGPSDPHAVVLPPLKSLLAGDSLRSPPITPRKIVNAGSHPTPFEPSYAASMHKPASLYPSYSKQRMDSIVDTAPPERTLPSPGMPGGPFMPQQDSRRLSGQMDMSPLRRPATMESRPTDYASGSPSMRLRSPKRRPIELSNPAGMSTNLPYRTPEQRAVSTTFEQPYPQHHAQQREPSGMEWRERQHSAYDRSTIRRHQLRSVRSFDAGAFSSHPRMRHRTPSRDPYPRADKIEHNQPHLAPGFSHVPYEGTQGALFVPSGYDYHPGKARKRGNLPKQSTEIMKNWFDQNISNPYPSEEQKAAFARATGVSMTQVSNWFINHRRRCPELRDKRTKSRNGKDGDI